MKCDENGRVCSVCAAGIVKDHLNSHIYPLDRMSRLRELNICHRPLPLEVEEGTSTFLSNSTFSFYVSLPSLYH